MAFMNQILTYKFSLTGQFSLWVSPTVSRLWKRIFTSKSVLQSRYGATGVWCDRFVAWKAICILSTRHRKWRLCKHACIKRIVHLKLVAFYFNSQNYEVILGYGWFFSSKYYKFIYFLWYSYLNYNTSIILALTQGEYKLPLFLQLRALQPSPSHILRLIKGNFKLKHISKKSK